MPTKQQNQEIGRITGEQAEKGFTSIMLTLLQERYPETQFQNLPIGISVFVDEYTTQFLEYYSGKRKRKPTAKSVSEAEARREDREEEGTAGEKWLTPDIREEFVARASMPNCLQPYLHDFKVS